MVVRAKAVMAVPTFVHYGYTIVLFFSQTKQEMLR